MKYWLMKSEPSSYSIDQFCKEKKTLWTAIRNYQARNYMINEMGVGDEFLFYHSSAEPPGVAGRGRIHGPATADPTAFDKDSDYFDPKATRERPIWQCVEVEFIEKFPELVSLSEIRQEKSLQKMALLQRGQRLSIQPVTKAEYEKILKMAHAKSVI